MQAVDRPPAIDDRSLRPDEPQDRETERGLARAGFADDADRLPLAHGERNAVDRFDISDSAAQKAFADRKPDAQVVGACDGRRGAIGGRRVALRLRCEKRAGIGMARIGEHARGFPCFDDLSVLHHDHIVGDAPDNVEVVGDEQHRHAELGLQVLEQLEDLRLHGDVERGRRLVGDQEVGAIGERHGDHHPLALAAGELVRIGAEPLRGVGDADLGQKLDDSRWRRRARARDGAR